jgi:hypothetical protein
VIVRRHRFQALRAVRWVPVLLLAFAWQAPAITFTLASAGPPVWTYTLTYGPYENYTGAPTTITLNGLTGVTAAGIPTSTDFIPSFNASQLMWTATVSNGGTTVTWTNLGPGTGNFTTPLHVFGFTVTAPGAPNGSAPFVTSGFVNERINPPTSVDTSGAVAGPSTAPLSVPVMSPAAFLLTMIGLGCVGAWESRRRWQAWFGRQA